MYEYIQKNIISNLIFRKESNKNLDNFLSIIQKMLNKKRWLIHNNI